LIKDSKGNVIKNQIIFPEDAYKEVNNIPPDAIFYAGQLDWRISNCVGSDSLFEIGKESEEADNANHDFRGIFIFSENPKEAKNAKEVNLPKLNNYSILDIYPMVLDFFK